MGELNLLKILSKGGWLIFPILLCSLIMIAVAVERFLTLRRARINTAGFMMRIRGALSGGDIDRARGICEHAKGPLAAVVNAGLEKYGARRSEIREILESAGNTEVFYLERYLGILATIAGVAPLIGFLGTVTGMIRAFMEIQALGGNVNADVLAGGIWEAMVTTAAGLTVGIPALILYNYFVGKVQRIVFDIETCSDQLLDLLAGVRANDET